MDAANKSRATHEETPAMRELFGIRARLVGDDLINEQGQVLAVVNRRAFNAWLLAHPSALSSSAFSLSSLQKERVQSREL